MRNTALAHTMHGLRAMRTDIERWSPKSLGGRVGVPILLWLAGVPLGIVVLLWLFFFRG
jgi:hypothetical protein